MVNTQLSKPEVKQSEVDRFMSFANALRHGYVKEWKARGMLYTFHEMKSDDRDRVYRWVKNCLEMEGFHLSDCEKITDWLMENMKYD